MLTHKDATMTNIGEIQHSIWLKFQELWILENHLWGYAFWALLDHGQEKRNF
jgi:hypothetical protein